MTEAFSGTQGGTPRSSFERFLDAVAAAGLRHEVKHGGTHIQAECPTHPDQQPSLSIDWKPETGKTEFYCHGGCGSDEAILAALDLAVPMIFDDYEAPDVFAARRAKEREEERRTGRRTPAAAKPRRRPVEKPRPALPKGRLPKRLTAVEPRVLGEWSIAAAYDYTDAAGTVIHQEVRHQRSIEVVDQAGGSREKVEKRFTQRWPDDKGGWIEKAPAGFVPVLYRLPDLTEWIDQGRPVWLCEGVKDADRLLALGEAATTNPSGAGNFKPQQARSLAGAHVVAVLDHDKAGYRRGIKLAELLVDVASLRLVLPATTGQHQDASDHLDAGYGLNDFVEATVEDLGLLELVAEAEEAVLLAAEAAEEAAARTELVRSATNTTRRETEERYAARWAAEAGKQLVRATTALETAARGELADDYRDRLMAAVAACQASTRSAHDAAHVEIPGELELHLQEPAQQVLEVEATLDDDLDNVIELPNNGWLPAPSQPLAYSGRMHWAFEVGGEGRRPRGVYCSTAGGDARWDKIADLPFVHARVLQRDGSGKPTGTFYMISASADSEIVMIGPDEIRSHSWTNVLNLPVYPDPKFQQAATGALEKLALSAELREATPRMDKDGKIQIPFEMPIGYLRTSDQSREDALKVWAEIAELVAENPKAALVLGASAVAPFIGHLNMQPHVVSMYGKAKAGKTTVLTAAAAMWGFPTGATEAGVRLSWNATNLSVPAFLGSLACLPAFMDEIGQAGDMKDSQWHQLISNITQGTVRMTRKPRSPGVQLGLTWRGIFFSTGNGTMGTDAVGRNAGVPRRMVELQTPFTNSKEHGQAIEKRVLTTYGHVGLEILDRHSLATVRALIAQSHTALGGDFGEGHEDAMAEHLAAHLAGALMLDDLLGTGKTLFNAALIAAAEFLDECAPPPSDADQLLEELTEWIAREPGAWPTREQYEALVRPKSLEAERILPVHGFKSQFAGYREDDHVFVTTTAFKQMVDVLDIERKVALRELWDRGLLKVQTSRRRRGEWLSENRVMGGSAYEIVLPPAEDDEDPARPENAAPDAPVGGGVGEIPNTVGGAVGGADKPLTCGVGGVGGVGGNSSRVDAYAREINFPTSETGPEDPSTASIATPPGAEPDGEGAAVEVDQPMPCTRCGAVVHAGECAPGSSPRPGTSESSAPESAQAESAQAGSTTAGRDRGPREARFSAPAAVVDGDGIHLADGSVRPLPQISHIGELAALTGRDQLRLGWGGGEDRLPDQGQIWLTAAALERLGLPATQPSLPDKALTKAQRGKEVAKIFARLDDHPMVAGALEAGWQLGQGGHLDVWTRIWHRDLLPGGALIVGLPWHRIEGVALFEDDPAPGELARRLLLFAQRVGVSYRITSAATGLDLIDHHRPPRRSFDDDRGQSRRRVALVRNTAAEIPPWRMKTSDARFTGLEQDFSWWRTWESLSEAERGRRYVHGYDRNASYLVPWRSIELGVEDLIHSTGDAAAWDGKERPGYYLIDAGWEWENWGLPDPGSAAGARVGNNRAWVTVHTLKQLKAHGVTPRVHESYTWGVTARYLEGPGTALAEARTALSAAAGEDPGSAAVLATVKALYSATVGKLAEREHRGDFHLWRPDWRDHVIGATKTAILHTITKAQELSGESPLVVDRDAIFYASDEPDPIAAWPGDPAKLGTGLGSWKPIGTTALADWGPKFLPKRTGRWHYADAVSALSEGGTDEH